MYFGAQEHEKALCRTDASPRGTFGMGSSVGWVGDAEPRTFHRNDIRIEVPHLGSVLAQLLGLRRWTMGAWRNAEEGNPFKGSRSDRFLSFPCRHPPCRCFNGVIEVLSWGVRESVAAGSYTFRKLE